MNLIRLILALGLALKVRFSEIRRLELQTRFAF